MMNITLTYDHRLIDGREAATFLVKVRLITLFSSPYYFLTLL
jgi:pyruvate/2-oxoglutarate dehydrogenase complex dihydrolipoamide acyltransferase (E2) component